MPDTLYLDFDFRVFDGFEWSEGCYQWAALTHEEWMSDCEWYGWAGVFEIYLTLTNGKWRLLFENWGSMECGEFYVERLTGLSPKGDWPDAECVHTEGCDEIFNMRIVSDQNETRAAGRDDESAPEGTVKISTAAGNLIDFEPACYPDNQTNPYLWVTLNGYGTARCEYVDEGGNQWQRFYRVSGPTEEGSLTVEVRCRMGIPPCHIYCHIDQYEDGSWVRVFTGYQAVEEHDHAGTYYPRAIWNSNECEWQIENEAFADLSATATFTDPEA